MNGGSSLFVTEVDDLPSKQLQLASSLIERQSLFGRSMVRFMIMLSAVCDPDALLYRRQIGH